MSHPQRDRSVTPNRRKVVPLHSSVARDLDDRETERLFKEPSGNGFVLVLCLILAGVLWAASWAVPAMTGVP